MNFKPLPINKIIVYSLNTFIVFLAFTGILIASGETTAQKNTSVKETQIDVYFQDDNLTTVFEKITQKTGFEFVYNKKELKDKVRFNHEYKGQTLYEVLLDISEKANLQFRQINKNINVQSKLEGENPTNPVQILEEVDISGKITDENGEGLPGATVVEKGTTNGTTTDLDGNYKLTVSEQSVLTISFVGYKTSEITVVNQSIIDVQMELDAEQLDEVVVVGYGTQKKSDLTGSVSSIDDEVFKQQPVTKVSEILQGRVAGVSVNSPSGKPGGNQVIRIRGANSINASNDPLVVVDGLVGADFTSLNPNNIESIEVLKDASATAIYGSRGANGVILVTTKKGKPGKAQISFEYFHRVQEVPKKVEVLSALEYARAANDRRQYAKYSQRMNDLFDYNYPTEQEILTPDANGSRNMTWLYFHPAAIEGIRRGELAIDWQDEIFRKANMDNYNLSVRGGTEDMSYSISGNYLGQKGLVINSEFERFNLRGTIDAKANDKLRIGLTALSVREVDNPVGEGGKGDRGVVSAALFALPVALGVKYPENFDHPDFPFSESLVGQYFNQASSYGGFGDSSPNSGSRLWNPVAAAMEPEREILTTRNTLSSYLDYEIIEGLNFKVIGGGIFTNIGNRQYFNEKIQSRGRGGIRDAFISDFEKVFWQNSNILTYKKSIDLHKLTFTGLFEQQYETTSLLSLSVEGFNNNNTSFNAIQAGETVTGKFSSREKRTLLSYMGRINYAFDDRFLVTASVRADGSSVFGENNKWGIFPSGALAWRLSNEEFIKSVEAIDNLKLRVSYGVTGNQAIAPYQTLSAIQTGGTGLDYPTSGGALSVGSAFNRIANPDLKWEKTAQTDFGFDLSLFEGRLNLVADYYYKKTSDLLSSRSLPGQTGFTSVLQNVGEVENKGLELLIHGTILNRNDFKWDAGINMTFNNNKVISLSTPEEERIQLSTGNVMYLIKGQPIGAFYGYQYQGVWKLDEEEQAKRYGQIPGTAKIIDQDNNGVYDENDKVFLGSAIPDVVWGINSSFSYRGLSLNVQFQGSNGSEIFNAGALERFDFENTGTTGYRGLERWHPVNNPDGYYQRYDYTGTINQTDARQSATNIFTRKDAYQSDIFVEDGSYVRLSNLTIGYDLPGSVSSKLGLGGARIYVSGQNLKLWTDYTGYDPELAVNSNDGINGYELNGYPKPRTYTIGLNLNF
ncbi:MAG: SusC/RagA family TonB-linked outer membrane protein [Cyclobacteriaceae bacterium]